MAITALCLFALYDTGRFFLHKRAIETLESRVYDGAAPEQTVAFPQNVNPMRWDGWVETERSWQKVNVDLTEEFDPQPVSTFWKQEPSPAIAAARNVPVFRVLEKFARTPLWRVSPAEEPAGANTVELIDLAVRAGRPARVYCYCSGGCGRTSLVSLRFITDRATIESLVTIMNRNVLTTFLLASTLIGQTQRWTEKAANDWYAKAALARRRKLHPGQRDQRAGDVAGRYVRSKAYRYRACVGREHRHEYNAGIPSRSALEAGSRQALRSALTRF